MSLIVFHRKALVVALSVLLAPVVAPAPAHAAPCTSPVRYAASTNTIYLVARQAYTLGDIKRACPSVPLVQVDAAKRVWQLNGDLVLQNGSTLTLHGGAAGGDVDTLRLRSLASNRPTEVSQLMANHGTLSLKSTAVTSWDDAANGPDTDVRASAGARGRAFIRVLSTQGAGGAALESRMDIVDSEVSYLGYYAAESYGVTYKSRPCSRENVALCAKVKVGGSQINSRFHHNYMGTYTWGARDMSFRGSRYEHNASYGLDPHDVSSNLDIERNTFAHNGNHGVICSQLCDKLRIVDNVSHDNGRRPWSGPAGDSDVKGQVHGIMIHRGVTNTLISGNRVWNHPNGAGIAIFDSAGNTVTDNRLDNNMVGIRLSVGAAENTISHNVVRRSGKYGVFMFKGTDLPAYTTVSGRPTGNVFDRNTVEGAGNPVKLTDSDATTFSGGRITGGQGPLVLANSSATIADPAGALRFDLDGTSSVQVTNRTGRLLGANTVVTPNGSRLRLKGPVTTTVGSQPITVLPSAGRATANPVAATMAAPAGVRISGQPPQALVTFTVSGLHQGVRYTVLRNGAEIKTATADASGGVRFTDAPPSSAAYTYTLRLG
jgi:mannuronan 5-epimerase